MRTFVLAKGIENRQRNSSKKSAPDFLMTRQWIGSRGGLAPFISLIGRTEDKTEKKVLGMAILAAAVSRTFSLAIKQAASGSKSIRCDCRLEEFGVNRDLHFIAYQSWITFDAEIFPVNARAARCSIYALPRGSSTGPCGPSSSSTMVFLTP